MLLKKPKHYIYIVFDAVLTITSNRRINRLKMIIWIKCQISIILHKIIIVSEVWWTENYYVLKNCNLKQKPQCLLKFIWYIYILVLKIYVKYHTYIMSLAQIFVLYFFKILMKVLKSLNFNWTLKSFFFQTKKNEK